MQSNVKRVQEISVCSPPDSIEIDTIQFLGARQTKVKSRSRPNSGTRKRKRENMAAVSIITRSHSHNQKKILTKTESVKIKASVNFKTEIPALKFPNGTGIGRGTPTGVMNEKTRSNIIVDDPSAHYCVSKKDKDSKKKVPAANTKAHRKSMRILIRKFEKDLSEKYSNGVPRPIVMPRTVEIFNGPPQIRSEQVQLLFMAGLGVYRKPDERGMAHQQKLLSEEYEKFLLCPNKDNETFIEGTISSPIEISNTVQEIASPIKTNNKAPENGHKLKEKDENSNWDVNMTVVFTPVSQNSINNDFSHISETNTKKRNLDKYESSDCNKPSNVINDEENWQSFGAYMEAQLKDEIIVKEKYSIREIEEDKIKIANRIEEWKILLKGP